MRQLGHGQSVMFFAPPECDAGIRAAAPRPLAADDTVHTADIVRWVLHETVEDIVHYAPHWVRQNLDYARRSVADRQFSDSADVAVLREAWLASESRTLQASRHVPIGPTLTSDGRRCTGSTRLSPRI
jgi:hypothetical protein